MLHPNGKAGNKKRMGTWSKLVALCTEVMGGYYRSNGTIVRNVASGKSNPGEDGEAIFVETDVQFASISERTHARVRHLETQRQTNIETILSIASGLMGDKVTMQGVDTDWATLFFNYAQDVSNKNMQSLWARALLCELRRPSLISKRSLSFLYHCDSWEINAFKKVANFAFIGKNGHPFVFRVQQNPYENDDIFTESRLLAHCMNAGMIAPQAQELVVGYEFEYEKKTHRVCHDFAQPGQSVGFYMHPFSKTGSDLVKLLGGLESIPSSNMQRRVVWDYLSDFIDLEEVGKQEEKGFSAAS